MEPTMILILVGILGALGGFMHWVTPGESEPGAKEVIRRVFIGTMSGIFFGSIPLLMLLEVTQDPTVVISAAIPVIFAGYGGLDLWEMAKDSDVATTAAKIAVAEKEAGDELEPIKEEDLDA